MVSCVLIVLLGSMVSDGYFVYRYWVLFLGFIKVYMLMVLGYLCLGVFLCVF